MKEIHINNLDILNGKTIKSAMFTGKRIGKRINGEVVIEKNYPDVLTFKMTDGAIYYIRTNNDYFEEED